MTGKEAYAAVRKRAKKYGESFEFYCATRGVPANTVYKWGRKTVEPKQSTMRKLGIVK